MSQLTRRINRLLGRTVGVQIIPGRTRSVPLSSEWFTQMMYFTDLLRRTADVPGDIVECGVADGRSLAMLASLLRAMGGTNHRHVWGFDAWAGLPSPSHADMAHEKSVATRGMFDYASTCRVREELAAHGWSDEAVNESITLVPGYFEDALPSFDKKISLLHIDVDLYESYRSCLTYLWPSVQPGGIVALDEYEEIEQWPGARRAVDEFLGSLATGAASLHEDERAGKWLAVKDSSRQ